MKMEGLQSKQQIRLALKKLRREIPPQRRIEAAEALCALNLKGTVLSFASFRDEINTTRLNLALAAEGRLILPKIAGTTLTLYRVDDPFSQLIMGPIDLLEPDPFLCEEVTADLIDVALVPALGFDERHHRIGYGKGYYDRFLAACPHIHSIGVGFKEQYISALPIEPTDFQLTSISLF